MRNQVEVVRSRLLPTGGALYRLTRSVTRAECSWLDRDFLAGEFVQEYLGHTYGCMTETGKAFGEIADGPQPFFELPLNAVEKVPCDSND